MPTKNYNPTSPARRDMSVTDYSQLTKKAPEKKLLKSKSKTAGRNSYGRITVRHRGGGNRRKLREIDWKRTKDGVPARVAAIEYDPNRSGFVALLHYLDGEKRYILQPQGLKVNDRVESGPDADIKVGNALPLERRFTTSR